MTKIEDGGPAYPVPPPTELPSNGVYCEAHIGMSLRDYFAGQAIAAAVGRVNAIEDGEDVDEMVRVFAIDAYKIADAMLIARNGGNDGE